MLGLGLSNLSHFLSIEDLDSPAEHCDNVGMEIHGTIQNGVVVLDNAASLPEGTLVTITLRTETVLQSDKRRVEFPLVKTGELGSIELSNERIAEILEEEIESLKRSWNFSS
jgi:hypothetical protein